MNKFLLTSLCTMACGSLQVVNAQQIQVAGKVSDESGTPVPSVTIAVKGTNTGTSTNSNGLFTLNANADATIVISAVGYQKQEISLNGRKTLTISLQKDENALDEVMVVAYGTAKKSTYTGSASTVKNDVLDKQPVTSFENALTGRVAGLQVSTSSGQAGSTPAIRIRGIGSMSASNEPLYVIDGVPVISGSTGQMNDYLVNSNNVMSTLNPADIETMTVLKDAAASALYGSRAANGVIIITTKKGKNGAPKINLKSSLGFSPSWATDNNETASVQDEIDMLYSVLYDSRIAGGLTDAAANKWVLDRFKTKFGIHGYDFSTTGTSMFEKVTITGKTDGIENREGKYYDWNDALFRTGIFNTNDLSVSGGTDNTNYYTSLSYTQDKSRIILNDYDRINGRVNLNQKIGKYLEFGSNINIAKTKLVGMNDTRNTGTNYLMQTRNLLWPLYWPTDYKTGNEWTARYGSLAYNPLYYNKEWENSSKTSKISAVESLTLRLLPELTVKTIFSYDETESKDHIYYSAKHYNGSSTNGVVTEVTSNIQKLVSSTTANYNKTFGLHNIALLAGFEAEKNDGSFVRATGKDLPSSALHTVSTAGQLDAGAYSWGSNMMSVLSRAEYNYGERYFASASLRRDGSSKLGPGPRWGNFWSMAGSWNLAKESFIASIEDINALRIRASYGVNGTLPLDDFGWRSLTAYSNKYMTQAGGALSNAADENLRWERNYTTNLALEFGFFQNKIFGSLEYFNRDSKDLIQKVPISTITGFSSTLRNIGQINNKGIEIELGSDIIKKQDFRWTASINAAFIDSKITKLSEGQPIVWYDPTGKDDRARFIYQENESTLAFYGLEWAGVDKTNGKNVWYTNDGTEGDFLFEGRGASYTYTKAKQTIIGNANPKVYGGINTDAEYKGISLGLNFAYKIGGKLYDATSKDVADDGYYWERIHAQYFVDESWSPTNTDGDFPMVTGRDLEDVNQISSRHLYDASYLRLKNISLAYKIPNTYLSKIGINNARVFFNGSNLLTLSKYKYMDPEVNQYGTRGWETPIAKTYTFGLEFNF
ncbi:TonB-dependent receptor [Sphingobacterium sp. SRCM116780]|uniref:SusC/RagA family TonB-linked outer membrane protein n=1 Tax=Sphingobacterium sp. SRCM116780 TaxID=2907623 RepID=UPI001F34A87F|nr:TonB-dependent receptor [Sphingobacterium sp. SRCM116780]UIR56579.1 TonB-dependent receptor [Sphingobacterium sp. SRCM116780]